MLFIHILFFFKFIFDIHDNKETSVEWYKKNTP